MSDVVIRAEGLGKKYLIGHQTTGRESYTALRDVLGRQVKGFIRSARDMAMGRQIISGDEFEEFWALKDVSFEIKRGEVVGIIGRNGAGKSTLLKVLSRITEPSEGRVEIRGRVASLLEVGTGFHPELTGRENIFLNGAILGMSRAEIRSNFDEIVAFAEVERFLDTPVKRYSSGMYVRLAFAVAAHLEPEILVVDEVLAVGDAEFQAKCFGKMGQVANGGRTVLFVSHNIAAVRELCQKGVLLVNGNVNAIGGINEVAQKYMARIIDSKSAPTTLEGLRRTGEGAVQFKSMRLLNEQGEVVPAAKVGDPIAVELEVSMGEPKSRQVRIGITIYNNQGAPIVLLANEASGETDVELTGETSIICTIPRVPLSEGVYFMELFLEVGGVVQDWLQDHLVLNVDSGRFYRGPRNVPSGWDGRTVLVENAWSFKKK